MFSSSDAQFAAAVCMLYRRLKRRELCSSPSSYKLYTTCTKGEMSFCGLWCSVFHFSLRKKTSYTYFAHMGCTQAPPTKQLREEGPGYKAKYHSSLVPRPLAHSGLVGGPEYEDKLHSWWIYKASMHKQCVPGPLPALWEGPGYEATFSPMFHAYFSLCTTSQVAIIAELKCISGNLSKEAKDVCSWRVQNVVA